jgi:RHS Repeat
MVGFPVYPDPMLKPERRDNGMKSDLVMHKLYGPVRSLNVDTFEFKEQDGQLVEKPCYGHTIIFNQSGSIVEYANRNLDGSTWRTINEYSSAGYRIATLIYDPGGQLIGRMDYLYDSDGRLIAEQNILPDGQITIPITYNYDAEGQKTKMETLQFPEDAHVLIGIEGTNTSISAEQAVTMQTKYDQQGDVFDVKVFNVQGEIVGHVAITRDAWGNSLEETIYSGDTVPFGPCSSDSCSIEEGTSLTEEQKAEIATEIARMFPPGTEMSKNINKYDEEGRLVESTHMMMGMITDLRIIKYDEYGNMSEELYYGSGGALENRAIFTHEYDEQGNWTKEVVSTVRSSDAQGELSIPCNVTRRRITYY